MLADRVRIGREKGKIKVAYGTLNSNPYTVYGPNGEEVPPGYYLAEDKDFDNMYGIFKYTNTTNNNVVIPHIIRGIPVTSYSNMFEGSSVTGVASNNVNVADIFYMFYNSAATSIDLSSFDTSNVTNMNYMFYNSAATSIDLSSFDTSKVVTMSAMFTDSAATSIDLSSFDTTSVTTMSSMFRNSAATSIDLSSFDTTSVMYMGNMFTDSAATNGYARTQADADKFNASSGKPAGLTFIVKP